jgi:hypothetical protein
VPDLRARDLPVVDGGRVRDPLLWLVVAGAGLRLAVAIGHSVEPTSDFLIYHQIADTLATAGDYGQAPGVHEAYWPPGWPALLGLGYRVFGTDPTVGALLAACLGTGTLILGAMIADRLLSRPFAIAVVALLALNPAWILFTSVLATEHLAAFLVTAILALILLTEPRPMTAIGIGALEGALLLTRADIGLAALAMLGAAAVLNRSALSLRIAGVAVLGTMVALAPWTIRNAVRFHEFVPTSANGGFAFYRGTFEVVDASVPDPDPPPDVGPTESPRGYDSYYLGRAFDQIRLHPGAWMRYNVQRLEIQYWHDQELLYWVAWPGFARHIYVLTDWIWRVLMVLVVVAAVAVVLRRAPPRPWVMPLVLIVAAVLLTSIFPGAARRHYPIAATVCIVAALGAQSVVTSARARRQEPVKAG